MVSNIKNTLREAMISFINNWVDNKNIINNRTSITNNTLIAKDNESNDKLYLFVGFNKYNDYDEYSYSFMVLDKENNPKTGYMTERNEVNKFLPDDIKKQNKIFPIIKDLTRELMDSYLPQNILRKTVEPLTGDSLKRYDEITNIMVNEFNYTIVSRTEDKWGKTIWKLYKDKITPENKDMNESYIIEHEYTIQETNHKMFDHVIPLLKDMNQEPLFCCKIKNNI